VSDISEEIPFEIPATWQWMRLEFLANIYTGNSISESEKKIRYTNVDGVDYIGTKDVGFDSQINYSNGISIPQQYLSAFKIAQIGSILMCIEGGSAGRKIGILNKNVCFGNKLCCFTPYVVMAEYIYYYLQSPSFFELFQNNKTGIIGGVSVNTLKRLLVAIPPINEQIRIVEKINELNRL
jgi:type I restriction enzyme S subunit